MTSKQPTAGVARLGTGTPAVDSVDSVGGAPLTIDAVLVAPLLGLAPDAFMAAIKCGTIWQLTERGIDDDEGRYRVTFRYRRRRCRIVVRPDIGTAAPA
jgi:hypothetical protein